MKKQNLNNKLTFRKAVVAELNDNQLQDVNGGSLSLSIVVVVSIVAGYLVSQVEHN